MKIFSSPCLIKEDQDSYPPKAPQILRQKQRDLKRREKDSPSSPEQRDEGDDIILLALNMSENFQKSVENIRKKLEKLDPIEVAVNNFQKSFEKLERRLQVLEEGHNNIKQDVEI